MMYRVHSILDIITHNYNMKKAILIGSSVGLIGGYIYNKEISAQIGNIKVPED